MKIQVVTPAPAGTHHGNRITALRWASILKSLGHRVTVDVEYAGPCDLLVALHALRSHGSVVRYRRECPDGPLIVALTGTDLYRDVKAGAAEALESLELASRLVVLQPLAIQSLPPAVRSKARVIYQSVGSLPRKPARHETHFEVCVVGHLRPVKDPFRAAEAARMLPPASRIRVLHVGAAMGPEMSERAAAEAAQNRRYRWLGEVPHWRARRHLASSHLLAMTSLMEGGATVVSEAIADSVPVLASNIDGSVGLLGADYPGYYPPGDTLALSVLMARAESEPVFYRDLNERVRQLKPLVDPEREKNSWKQLLEDS